MKQLACAILFSAVLPLPAATLTVGQPNTGCTNAQYSSIGDAVKAASAGDLIEICPALYQEQLTITKPLTCHYSCERWRFERSARYGSDQRNWSHWCYHPESRHRRQPEPIKRVCTPCRRNLLSQLIGRNQQQCHFWRSSSKLHSYQSLASW